MEFLTIVLLTTLSCPALVLLNCTSLWHMSISVWAVVQLTVLFTQAARLYRRNVLQPSDVTATISVVGWFHFAQTNS